MRVTWNAVVRVDTRATHPAPHDVFGFPGKRRGWRAQRYRNHGNHDLHGRMIRFSGVACVFSARNRRRAQLAIPGEARLSRLALWQGAMRRAKGTMSYRARAIASCR